MSKKLPADSNFNGLSVNERLLVSGQLDSFDKAGRARNRDLMIAMLQKVKLTEKHARSWVDALLSDQNFFYF